MPEPTPAEAEQINILADELRTNRYVDLAEHVYPSGIRLNVGTRVRHAGEQWPEALEFGTGNIVRLLHLPNSSWSRSWGMPDVELIVLHDQQRGSSRVSQLAQYHVAVITEPTDANRQERPRNKAVNDDRRGRLYEGQVARFTNTSPVVAATDASVVKKASGFGYVTTDGRWGVCGRRRVKDWSDVDGLDAVVAAELRAVEFLLSGGGPPPELLLVDSLECLHRLRCWQEGGAVQMPADYRLRERTHGSPSTLVRLADLMSGRHRGLQVEHVAAHGGHPLNEAADSLAKIGCRWQWEDRQLDVSARATPLVEAFVDQWLAPRPGGDW